ncbi:hypothetical protein [Paenibacillus sp. MMO-177]|uniref:hypothetical protein n=1 Tax=Paenibacillus sp. MMO-177 TaxID=3081289 RepID=UPI003017F418
MSIIKKLLLSVISFPIGSSILKLFVPFGGGDTFYLALQKSVFVTAHPYFNLAS